MKRRVRSGSERFSVSKPRSALHFILHSFLHPAIAPSSSDATVVLPKMQGLDSSSLTAAGYDAGHEELTLAFRHGGLYRYFGVPRRTYRALMRAESKGQFFTGQIRGHYRFQKIAEEL